MKLEYEQFYDIAKVLNEMNRNTFTEKEIASNAHEYTIDYWMNESSGNVSWVLRALVHQFYDDIDDMDSMTFDELQNYLEKILEEFVN